MFVPLYLAGLVQISPRCCIVKETAAVKEIGPQICYETLPEGRERMSQNGCMRSRVTVG